MVNDRATLSMLSDCRGVISSSSILLMTDERVVRARLVRIWSRTDMPVVGLTFAGFRTCVFIVVSVFFVSDAKIWGVCV